VRVIGIDVAPKKGGHVYEGGDRVLSKCPKCLNRFLDDINEDVLIAWDAPLTACTGSATLIESDLTRRMIEAFFSSGRYKAPKGVSVLPYSGCPHWTISRRMLGLPRLGPYDSAVGLPFTLIVRDDDRPATGRNVVEVHPALALWRWFVDARPKSSWIYKKEPQTLSDIWALLKSHFAAVLPEEVGFESGETPNDDELDAVIAWLLAHCWLHQENVALIGDDRTRALLLPKEEVLQEDFQRFSDRELRRRQGVKCRCK
jgi:predicted RNase H-like nuclease